MEYPFGVVAVDVGGTKIACAVVRYENADAAPIILSKRSIPTDAQQGGEVVLARILDLADDVRAEALSHGETIVGVGVATAGRVDVNTGNIAFANEIMPGWSGQPLGDALRVAVVRIIKNERFHIAYLRIAYCFQVTVIIQHEADFRSRW